MRKLHPGLWTDLTVKLDLAANSKAGASGGSGAPGGRPGKKRRHQRQQRIYPIQLEPLEQRQLLSTSVTQDLFAATTGTVFNSTNFPWWTNVDSRGQSPTIVDDQFMMTGVSTNPGTFYLATGSSGVNGTTSTINSVQQVSFSALGFNSSYGLVARAASDASTSYSMEVGAVGTGNTAVLNIFRSVNNTQQQHLLASVTLSTENLVLNYGNVYNLKFLVQTDPVNASMTDLYADVWQQGQPDLGWQLSTNDSTTQLNVTGVNSSGYDGILAAPNWNGGNTDISYLSNYMESDLPTGSPPNDLPEINSFTASPTSVSGNGTVLFNATATAPTSYLPGGPGTSSASEFITSYTLNFGDNVTSTYTSLANIVHTYTTNNSHDAYNAVLTVTDTSGSTTSESLTVETNPNVTTAPTGTLKINRNGGNGINSSNPLIVQFITSGTPYSSSGYSIASYTMNFGDGDVSSMPIAGGSSTSTLTFNLAHDYTTHGTFYPTLTLVGNDGATTVINSSSIMISGSSSPPTVSTSFNSTTNILSAVFSEDVGAALVGQTSGTPNFTPLGEPLWTDAASTVNTMPAIIAGATNIPLMIPSSFATDLDIRNDNSGANVALTSTTLDSIFSYSNTAPFTATWNLFGLLNTTSTSYTARLFAATTLNDPGTGIQDQAGNDLDGINSGIGGQDATLHFGSSYPNSTLNLYNSTMGWNSSMPLVFAPSIQPIAGGPGGSIYSISTSSGASTILTFADTTANQNILSTLNFAYNGPTVLIEDMPSGYTKLDGFWVITAVTYGGTCSITIPVSSTGLNDSLYTANAGNMHISPTAGAGVDNSGAYVPEQELVDLLAKITGAANIPYTGTNPSSGIYVGETSQFDTNTTTDLGGYAKSFDDEAQLGATGYIVKSIVSSSGNSLYLVGGPTGTGSGENDAIDAFLQSVGLEEYGPSNNSTNPNVWRITPNYNTTTGLMGSWDIRQVPSISDLFDSDGSGGETGPENSGWDKPFLFNYGGGSPTPEDGQSNLGFSVPTGTDLYADPDWWASNTNMTLSYGGFGPDDQHDVFAATFTPLNTINNNDTFSIVLGNSGVKETVTVTATATDEPASSIVNALYNAIFALGTTTSSSYQYFESTNITVTTNMDYNTDGPLSLSSTQNPVVEIYQPTIHLPTYTVSTLKNGMPDPNFLADVYQDTKLNFANPGVYYNAIAPGGWVHSFVNNGAPGSMKSLSANDGQNYDQSISTQDTMHSNNAWQDSNGDWWGYNQNGVVVSAASESYWTLVNELAQYVLINESAGQDLLLGALAYTATSQPASFPMEPNVYIDISEFSDQSTYGKDQEFKIDTNAGALVGTYKNWAIFLDDNYGNPAPGDFVTNTLEKDFTIYNNDHLFALEGENAPSYTAEMPGYLMAGLLGDNASTANAVTMQNVLTTYYNSSFGPAAPYVEDNTVMFNGPASDPNLLGPPAQVSFDGNAYNTNQGGHPTVITDLATLQESFGYLDAAENALTNAYNNGNNASFNTTQYNADQARVDQIRMYDVFLFDEYQLEYDYYHYNIKTSNSAPPLTSLAFNTIVNDLTVLTNWVDELESTDLVNTDNFDGAAWGLEFGIMSYFYNANTPISKALLKLVGPNGDPTPTQTELNGDWSTDEPTLNMPPAVPTSLIAIAATTAGTVNLTWTDNDAGTASGYYIDRSTTSTGGFTQLSPGTVGPGVTSYHDTTATTSGLSYYYEVDSYGTNSASDFSNVASPMAAPSGLTAATASNSQIDLSWADNDGGNATGYAIDRSTTSTGGWTQIATVGTSPTAYNSYNNTALTDGTTYYYEVAAFNGTTTSSFSSIASAVTTMNAPSSLNATAVNNSNRTPTVDLSWTDNDNLVATAYFIDRSTTSTGGFLLIGTTGGAGATTYSDTSVTQDTQYFYEVDAVGAGTTSFFSNIFDVTTLSNEVGGLVNDDFYSLTTGSSSSWSTQWTKTGNTANATPALTISTSYQGKAKFTSSGGHMSGNYVANINTVNYVDSYQNVLVSSDTNATGFELAARTALTSDSNGYFADLTWNTTSSKANLEIKVGSTVIGSLATAMAITTAPTYDLEFEVVTVNSTTTDLYAKIWNITSATEPTTWSVTAVDSTGSLQNGNSSNVDGMNFILANASENTFLVDNYESVNLVSSNASYIDNFQNSSTSGWAPLTASRWTVGTAGNSTSGYSVRYYINTTSYSSPTGGGLGEYSLLSAYPNIGDFTMTVDVAAAKTTAGSNYAIVFGYQDPNNYYFMEFNANSGATQLYKVVSGTASVIPTTVTGGQIIDKLYHSIEIQRKGTSISVWFDGEPVLSTTDATYLDGEIGLGALNDGAYFDNVIVG